MSSVNLPRDFYCDPWVAAFVCEIFCLFGAPVDGSECNTKADKIQHLWAKIGIANALHLEEPMWRAMKGRVDPEKAAEEFSRRFYDSRKKMVIEEAPSFFPKLETNKSLPAPESS